MNIVSCKTGFLKKKDTEVANEMNEKYRKKTLIDK